LATGLKVVALKLGESGCLIYTKDGEMEVPGFKRDITSSLGAGDAFNGGFLHGYLRGWPLDKVARFANAVAGIKISKPGAQAGLPSESEVEAFLAAQEGG
jgi:sugar/nucleoside kinase (ribokinase family)